ncbi:MAG TPA: hypothetical protein D7I15_07180 [Candidatus Poseidoniales archaeon]|nr:MAG TPA: hypothetical protein D7I15_07180 [Candidatus Poseidoniales archaeon]
MRSTSLRDWRKLLPDRSQSIFAAVCVLLFSGVLVIGAIDGPGVDEDVPNYRFGVGDVNVETVEVHSLWDPVTVEVSNVGDSTVEVLLIKRKFVESHAQQGTFDWPAFVSDGTVVVLDSADSTEFEVMPASLFDVHLILMKLQVESNTDPSAIGELRITPHYVDDELMWSAFLASWPAFIIFGISLEGLLYRSKDATATL